MSFELFSIKSHDLGMQRLPIFILALLKVSLVRLQTLLADTSGNFIQSVTELQKIGKIHIGEKNNTVGARLLFIENLFWQKRQRIVTRSHKEHLCQNHIQIGPVVSDQ